MTLNRWTVTQNVNRANGLLGLARVVKKLICGHIIMETKTFFRSINWKKAHLMLPFFGLAC